jgi:hypothetical protein
MAKEIIAVVIKATLSSLYHRKIRLVSLITSPISKLRASSNWELKENRRDL